MRLLFGLSDQIMPDKHWPKWRDKHLCM